MTERMLMSKYDNRSHCMEKKWDMFKGILVVFTVSFLAGCVNLWRVSAGSPNPIFDPDQDVGRIQLSENADVRLSPYAEIIVRRFIHASVVDTEFMDVDCQVSARKVTLIQGLYKDAPYGQLYLYRKTIRIKTSVLKQILESYVFRVPNDYGSGDSPYSPKRLHVTYNRADNKCSKIVDTDSIVRFERPFDEIWYQLVKQRITDNIEDRFYFPTNDIWCAESMNSSR